MEEHNLILTDIMKTGHHYFYGNYIRYASIENQRIEIVNDYYRLPNDLSKYKRKIALICTIFTWYMSNTEFVADMNRRLDKLKSLGFKFIIVSPWESRANVKSNTIIKKYQPQCFTDWYGEHDWFWFYMYDRHLQKKDLFHINHDVKKYDFLYLNKLGRTHRRQLFLKIKDTTDLLDNSLYSFIGEKTPIRLPREYEAPWVEGGIYQMENLNGQDQDIFEKPYNDSKYSLITESNVNNNETFITEKIWKAIIMKHVFVVYGNYKTLETLRQQGFKTFNDIFDEEYDGESDADVRMWKLVELCKKLKSTDYKEIYNQTKEIREHNFKNFFNRDNIVRNCSNTVKQWLTLYN
jgi:hypothetical protein